MEMRFSAPCGPCQIYDMWPSPQLIDIPPVFYTESFTSLSGNHQQVDSGGNTAGRYVVTVESDCEGTVEEGTCIQPMYW